MRPEHGGLLLRRVLVALAALAGLFAMHGMADHGVASATLPAATAAMATMAGHDAGSTGHHDGTGDGTDDGSGGGHSGTMAELCLALLVLAAAGLAAGLLSRGRPLLALRPAPTRWRVLIARAARFRDPPDLFRLSVQRC
ncbi:DUF6153 family protein [Nocardioides sp. WV_118_6]|uniref:DUF6153 family protein n=1 Tax=Nocardioides simplex TaxID=2045 RepID=UPI002150638F|nr:DUF6153 family protein [Pimelobacter simplex]UUW91158.1 DUF6153 family protein [Pimelobacter simplex]UUW94986.1 DUF6153 family protein [Pimelobacter simplex]